MCVCTRARNSINRIIGRQLWRYEEHKHTQSKNELFQFSPKSSILCSQYTVSIYIKWKYGLHLSVLSIYIICLANLRANYSENEIVFSVGTEWRSKPFHPNCVLMRCRHIVFHSDSLNASLMFAHEINQSKFNCQSVVWAPDGNAIEREKWKNTKILRLLIFPSEIQESSPHFTICAISIIYSIDVNTLHCLYSLID